MKEENVIHTHMVRYQGAVHLLLVCEGPEHNYYGYYPGIPNSRIQGRSVNDVENRARSLLSKFVEQNRERKVTGENPGVVHSKGSATSSTTDPMSPTSPPGPLQKGSLVFFDPDEFTVDVKKGGAAGISAGEQKTTSKGSETASPYSPPSNDGCASAPQPAAAQTQAECISAGIADDPQDGGSAAPQEVATMKEETSCDEAANFRDPLSVFARHQWLFLVLCVIAAVALYALGLAKEPSVFFAAIEIPTIAAITYVVFPSRELALRVPLFCVLTSGIVYGSFVAASQPSSEYASMGATSAAAILVLYSVARAVRGTVRENLSGDPGESTLRALATAASTWGATLQVVFLAAMLVDAAWGSSIHSVPSAWLLSTTLHHLRELSPFSWVPRWFLGCGILLYVADRLRDEPYLGLGSIESRQAPDSLGGSLKLLVLLPLWIVRLILGFLTHLTSLAVLSLWSFVRTWLGRFALIVCGVVIPSVFLFASHTVILAVAENLAGYLNETHDISIRDFVGIHFFMILALTFYVISTALLAIDIRPVDLLQLPTAIRAFFVEEGYPAAHAVARSFSFYGAIFFAVPIASTFLWGIRFGVFSYAYLTAIGATIAYVVVSARFANQKADTSTSAEEPV